MRVISDVGTNLKVSPRQHGTSSVVSTSW